MGGRWLRERGKDGKGRRVSVPKLQTLKPPMPYTTPSPSPTGHSTFVQRRDKRTKSAALLNDDKEVATQLNLSELLIRFPLCELN